MPQGAPESPLLFTCVVDDVLTPLLESWRQRGLGWSVDSLWLPALAYADDVILLAKSRHEVTLMLQECMAAFAAAGLEVGLEKTFWSSTTPLPNQVLTVNGVQLEWRRSLTFVGTVLEFGGHDADALQYRIGQAMKQFGAWAPLLLCKWLPLKARMKAFKVALISSVTWLSSTSRLTVAQERHLSSWAARTAARIGGVRRGQNEDMGQFWRRMHRSGHQLLRDYDADPVSMHRLLVHRLAGHLARLPDSSVPHTALVTRPLAWWRHAQSEWTDRHSGLHPKRFHCWRWEGLLESWYGVAALPSADASALECGWLQLAQDREGCKAGESAFAAARGGDRR